MVCGLIHYFGWCHWRFRPYGGSLFSDAKKVTKNACPSIGPTLRSGSPPFGATAGDCGLRVAAQPLHLATSATPRALRAPPSVTPALGLLETGRKIKIKSKIKSRSRAATSRSSCRKAASAREAGAGTNGGPADLDAACGSCYRSPCWLWLLILIHPPFRQADCAQHPRRQPRREMKRLRSNP